MHISFDGKQSLKIFSFLLLLAAQQLFSQQQKNSLSLNHPISSSLERDDSFFKRGNGTTAFPDTLHLVGILVEFKKDSDVTTTGNGLLDTSAASNVIDSPPHDSTYFADHCTFASNYFRKVSNGKLIIDYTVFGKVIQLPKKMKQYSPKQTSTRFYELDTLMMDAWSRADSIINFSQFPDTNHTAFIIFHAGVGRDIDLASTYGYNPRPFDIPTIYRSYSSLKKNFGDDYAGIPVAGGTYHIKNTLILPETESRKLPNGLGGEAFVQFGLNGMVCGSIGSYLGLPDLFDTKTGRSGIGRFGLMDGEGIFSWNGYFPPEPSAWEKYFMGWLDPITVLESRDSISLPAVSLDTVGVDSVYKIPISSREYFLVENRIRDARNDSTIVWMRQNGAIVRKAFLRDTTRFSSNNQDSLYGSILDVDEFDFSLPGGFDENHVWYNGGMLIWHVDENVIDEKFATDEINTDVNYRGIDVEQANGAQDIGIVLNTVFGPVIGNGSAFDFWYKDNPLRKNKKYTDEFTPVSFPSTYSNDGANSHISITGISKSQTRMVFSVHIGDEDIKPLAGFPKYTGEQFGKNSVRLADIDGDTDNEIIVVTTGDSVLHSPQQNYSSVSGSTVSKIYAWNFDGTKVLAGGNVNGMFAQLSSQVSITSPFSKFLNVGNTYQIVVYGNTLQVLNNADNDNNGFADTVFVKTFAKNIVASPAVTDSIIAVPAEGSRAYFLRYDGSMIDSMTVSDSTDEILGVTLFDNSSSQFMFTSHKGMIQALYVTTTQILTCTDGCFASIGSNIVSPAVYGVLNANEKQLFVATERGEIYEPSLSMVQNNIVIARTGDSIFSSPILADVNGDGNRDIVVLSGTKIFAFNSNGTLLDYFPIQTPVTKAFLAQPLAADVNGDGMMDIVCVAQDGRVFAYDNRGKMLSGFPLLSGRNSGATPAITLYVDTIALVVASDDGNVYAWRTGTVTPSLWKTEWTQLQHDAKGSGLITTSLVYHPISNEFLPKARAYNYPNPVYTSSTTIRYYLSHDATVSIRIFDLAGELVEEINNPPGTGGFDSEVEWDVSKIQSGVYFANIEAKSSSETAYAIIKIAIVK